MSDAFFEIEYSVEHLKGLAEAAGFTSANSETKGLANSLPAPPRD